MVSISAGICGVWLLTNCSSIFLLSLMQLIFRHYFSKKSLADCGTLYQLRNVLGRTNVVQRPLDNFNACDDFFVLVVHAYIGSSNENARHIRCQ